MEFEEVNNYIKTERSQQPDIGTSFGHVNLYNSIIHQPIARKPTLSNFVHRLKQHSSKTRFISQYKKMSVTDSLTSDDDGLSDDASIRVIDPSRTRGIEQEDEELIGLDVLKKPIKRVKINEGANQITGMKRNDSDSFKEPEGDVSIEERFITFDIAIDLINKDVTKKTQEILKEMKRIEYNKNEISRYKQDLINIQNQLDLYQYSLSTINQEHLSEMKLHELNSIKNLDKMKETKRKNMILKSRFEKYRKVMSLDTRLIELEKKIKQAWKRDEIWIGIRDWGLLFIILLSILFYLLLK